MDINWYPGHMAKAKRLLADQLSRVDVVVELCDARLPYSSRNPDLDKLLAGKKRVLLLNKADLADPAATSAWLNYFRAQGIDAAPYSASTGKAKDALAVIDRAAKEAVERAAQKGIRKTVKAMVVGVPNVGKSTFTNKLHGGNIAKTGDRPGVTRANLGLQLHISVRFYLAFHDLIGIFAGISVIGCHPEGSFVIPVRYRFRIRYDCCRSCVLEFHFGVVQRYRIGNGYCYCIVRNVGRVRFPVHGHHDRCDEIFICIFRYNFIVFVTRSQKEQG